MVPPASASSASLSRSSANASSASAHAASAPSSILAAAIGLTSLGSPSSSPGKPSLSPSASDVPPMMALKPAAHKTPAEAMSRSMQPLSIGPSTPAIPPDHYQGHLKFPPPHPPPAATAAFSRAPVLESPLPLPSAIHPSAAAGFGALPILPPSGPASAMDRFPAMSLPERVAAIDGAAAAPLYARYQPQPPYCGMAGLPLMPPPHQTAPVPNTKNFPETLFDIISSEQYAHIISWLPHGRGFIIHDKQRFASMILPRYFDGAKFTSFTRRLKRWNFVRVPRGPELGAYYNKKFMRDRPELVQEMRYRTDGQFEKKGEDSDEECVNEDEKVGEERTGKEDEKAKAEAERLPKKKGVEAKRLSKSLPPTPKRISQEKNSQIQHQELPAKVPSPDLARRPKPAIVHSVKSAGPRGSENLGVHPAHAYAPPPRYPTLVPQAPQANQDERRLMDVHEEMLLARSMLSHEVASETRPVPVVPGTIQRPIVGGALPSHPHYAAVAPPQRMLGAERAKLVLEADRLNILSADHHHRQNSILVSTKPHDDILDVSASGLQPTLAPLTLAPPFVHHLERSSSITHGSTGVDPEGRSMTLPLSGDRPVMMSQEEEKEFTEYLYMKRESTKAQQWPGRYFER